MARSERPVVEQLGESLARRVARRQFLKGAAAVIFGAVTAWGSEGFRVSGVRAGECYTTQSDYGCSPPFGRYCASGNCSGSDCVSPQCRPDFDAEWPTACWCTLESCDGSYLGYFVCCDCYCPGGACGCAQFVATSTC